MNRFGDPRYEQPLAGLHDALTDPMATAAPAEQRAMRQPADMSDDELNTAVAVEVMEWRLVDGNWVDAAGREQRPGPGVTWSRRQGRRVHVPSWSPATDIAAAMNEVVGECCMRRRIDVQIKLRAGLTPQVWAWSGTARRLVKAANPSVARAICEAVLAAVVADRVDATIVGKRSSSTPMTGVGYAPPFVPGLARPVPAPPKDASDGCG